MSTPYRVALLGFSDFERSTLASCFRLAPRREPSYTLVDTAAQAHFLVADADRAATVHEVTAAARVDDTVFIGHRPPPGATVWMVRPIDPLHVMRELDAMVALQTLSAPPAPQPVQPARPSAMPTPPRAETPAVPRPLAPERARRAPAPPPAPGAAAASSAPRALLVDDSEIACAYLARRLQAWGVQCTTAPDSTRALQLLKRERFDLVFMDVELGAASALDGLALCQRLRRQHPAHGADSPLLAMVSAHHRELDRARGALAGADAYLGKPLDGDELAQVMRRRGIKPVPDAPA